MGRAPSSGSTGLNSPNSRMNCSRNWTTTNCLIVSSTSYSVTSYSTTTNCLKKTSYSTKTSSSYYCLTRGNCLTNSNSTNWTTKNCTSTTKKTTTKTRTRNL